jgi:formylglycine-generating enzyme required for sulfatase activity
MECSLPVVVRVIVRHMSASPSELKWTKISCSACGSVSFQGDWWGWYEELDAALLDRSLFLEDRLLVPAAKSQVALMRKRLAQLLTDRYEEADEGEETDEDDLDELDIEPSWSTRQFQSLEAEVKCQSCGLELTPEHFAGASEPSGDWTELCWLRRPEGWAITPALKAPRILLRRSGRAAARKIRGVGACPICCSERVALRFARLATRAASGKFSGRVIINDDTFGELIDCFRIDYIDEKFGDFWRWSQSPDMNEELLFLSCNKGCFDVQFEEPSQIPAILLAVLAHFEAAQPVPAVDRLKDLILKMALEVSAPKYLSEQARAFIAQWTVKPIGPLTSRARTKKPVSMDDLRSSTLSLFEKAVDLSGVVPRGHEGGAQVGSAVDAFAVAPATIGVPASRAAMPAQVSSSAASEPIPDTGSKGRSVHEWADVLVDAPNPSIITDSSIRERISVTGLPWRVRDRTTGIEMVVIPPGKYMRGASPGESDADDDERPAHEVVITKAFYMGVYEVTQGEWQKLMGNNPSYFRGDRLPVEEVSWEDAHEFLRKSNGLRLPTEGEWEYACRADTRSSRHGELDAIAWHGRNSRNMTHAVGSQLANGYGLHDTLGNVWEWCADWYGSYNSSEQRDPAGPSSGEYRVCRGGSWYGDDWGCRASYRFSFAPAGRLDSLGFRVARTP